MPLLRYSRIWIIQTYMIHAYINISILEQFHSIVVACHCSRLYYMTIRGSILFSRAVTVDKDLPMAVFNIN